MPGNRICYLFKTVYSRNEFGPLFGLSRQTYHSKSKLGAAVAEWLSSWIAEKEDQGSISGLATWIFRDWLSPAYK